MNSTLLRLLVIPRHFPNYFKFQNINSWPFLCKSVEQVYVPKAKFSTLKGLENTSLKDSISSWHSKKRSVRKKKSGEEDLKDSGLLNVVAHSTAEEYNLERLIEGLKLQNVYEFKTIHDTEDVLYAVAKYQVEQEPREIFFFREGSVVFWNITDLESSNLLTFLKQYEVDNYSESLIQQESEVMTFKPQIEGKRSMVDKNGNFLINYNSPSTTLDKYTFSNVLASSVKLGIWEALLDKYIDSIAFISEDLKYGRKIKMSREDVLRKHGELFALRHLINLSSDLLDTPDFYWDNEELETLYLQCSSYFCISKRIKVMNEKINHCVEIIELLSAHLSDKHHIRLEWMIIVLIMVEVAFETLHYIDRYISRNLETIESLPQ